MSKKLITKDEFIKNIGKLFDEEVVKMRSEESYLQARFRASGIADCPRALTLQLLNLPEDKYPRAKNDTAKGFKLMQHGTDIHTFIQKVLIHMGLMTEDDLEEQKRIQDDEKYLLSGHPDGVLTLKDMKCLLEIKSINSGGYKYLKEPKIAHFYQGHTYLAFLEMQYGLKLAGIIFLYAERENDDMGFKPFWIPRDQKVIDMVFDKLLSMRATLESGKIEEIPAGYDPTNKKMIPCRWCPFNNTKLCRSGKNKISEFPEANIVANIQIQEKNV